MKVSVQVYKPPENDKGPKIPASFQILQPTIIQGITWMMRLFGISKISMRPIMVTLLTVPDITFKTLIENPPPEFMASRNFIAKTIGQLMLLYGVMDIEIHPDEKELRSLRSEWSDLVRGINPAGINNQNIKLNTETDPTGESVLNDSTNQITATNTAAPITASPAA